MRATLLGIGFLAFGCGQVGSVQDGSAVSVSSQAMTAEMPLTTVTLTEDCEGGGTVQLTGSLDTVETPPKLDLSVSFTYTACVTDKYGTVGGTVAYTKVLEEVAPDFNSTVTYSSNLTLDTHSCTANFSLNSVLDATVDKLEVAGSCPHPYSKYLEKLEKDCKLKKPKKGKKDKCSLF